MRDDLIRRLRADRAAGTLEPLEVYQRLFPGADAEVATAYALEGRADDSPSSGVGNPAARSAIGLDSLAAAGHERIRVVGEIGRGGMGVVLEVEDRVLGRSLAMKRVNAGTGDMEADDASTQGAQLVRRLLEEAQVTAQLDHPGVVPVHDLGLDPEGHVYFTMKKIHGRTLERVLEDRRRGEAWPLSRALQVFLRICETLAYAHRKGVVHRDVKPANVMVGRFGEVYLMDWGVAKVRGDPADPVAEIPSTATRAVVRTRQSDGVRAGSDAPLTVDGQMVGTVGYMPPEQVAGGPVDARADVYAVGAMLYELLAGHAPFREPDAPGGARAFWERLFEGEPTPLGERAPEAPPELVSIATKALARDPANRFASASELADELHAFLEGRVVRSYRTGLWVEVKAWTRRNRWLAAGLLAALLLTGGAVVAFVAQQRLAAVAIGEQRDVAVAAAARATAAQRRSEGLRLAAQSADAVSRDPGLGLAVAVEAARLAPGPEANGAIYRALRTHREIAYLGGHEGYVNNCRFLKDGRRLLSSDESGILVLWDAEARRGLRWFDTRGGMIADLAVAADESWAAAAHADGRVRVRDIPTGAAHVELDASATALHAAPDGTLVTAETSGAVRRWNVAQRSAVVLGEHRGGAWLAKGSEPGATVVASLGADGRLVVHPLSGGAGWSTIDPAGAPASPPTPPEFWARVSTRARRVCVRWPGGSCRLHDLDTGAPVGDPMAGTPPTDAAFSSDGRRLMLVKTLNEASALETRDPVDGRVLATFACPSKAISPSPDGRLVAFVSQTEIEVYDVERGVERCRLTGNRYHVRTAAWSPDGRRIASASHDGSVRVFEVRRSTERDGLVERVRAGARTRSISDDATTALVAVAAVDGDSQALEVVDTNDGTTRARIVVPSPAAERALLTSDGKRVVYVDGLVWHEFDVAAARESRATPLVWPAGAQAPGALRPSPDGRRAAIESGDLVLVFDLASGALACSLGESGTFGRPAWHPDGRRLVLARGAKRETELYDTTDGRLLRTFRGHTGFVICAAIDPAGNRLATSAVDSSVRIYDLETGTLAGRFIGMPMTGSVIAFGPDGRRLAHVSSELTLFDTTPGAVITEFAALKRGPDERDIRFHPDGRQFWTVDDEQRIRLFGLDARESGERAMSRPLQPYDRVQFDATRALDPDGPSARFFGSDDPWWALQRGALLLNAGRVEEALAAARASVSKRPEWARPRLLLARALAASASRPSTGVEERARGIASVRDELGKAIEFGVADGALPPGSPVPAEFVPFLGDAGVRDALQRLECDLGG